MKIMITALALMVLPLCARAATPITNAQAVKQVVPNQTTCSSTTLTTSAMDVSSNTATSTSTFATYDLIVRNLSTGATVFCSHDSGVATSGAKTGDEIVAWTGAGQPPFLRWAISTMQQWFCLATVNQTAVMICKQH